MAEDKKENLLQKAHSVATHLARISKAVTDFHDKMGKVHEDHMERLNKLHKAHKDDMHAAIGQLHKMVGVEPTSGGEGSSSSDVTTSNEPTSRNLTGDGTKNLQDFGDVEGIKAAAAKAAADKLTADKGVEVNKTEIADMFKDFLLKVDEKLESQMTEFAKAMFEPTEVTQQGPVTLQVSTQPVVKQYSNGVGDRTQVQHPIQQVAGPDLTKAADATQQQQPVRVVLTPQMAEAAVNGDIAEKLLFMKSVKAESDIPATLIAPLSKVHS